MNEFIEFKKKIMESHPDLCEMPDAESADALRRYRREIEIIDKQFWPSDIRKEHARAAVAVLMAKLESWINLYGE